MGPPIGQSTFVPSPPLTASRSQIEPSWYRAMICEPSGENAVVQHDHRPGIGRQSPQNRVEELPVIDRPVRIGDHRLISRRQLDLDRPTPAAPNEVQARAGDQGAKPAAERVRFAQRRQVPPGPNEALLDRIPGEVMITDDEAGHGVEPRDMHAGELGEGVMIAALGSLHEGSLVHRPPIRFGATHLAALG